MIVPVALNAFESCCCTTGARHPEDMLNNPSYGHLAIELLVLFQMIKSRPSYDMVDLRILLDHVSFQRVTPGN